MATAKKKTAPKKKTVRGLKKVCSSNMAVTGLKVNGTLKKGFKYVNGKPKKVVKKVTKK